MIEKRASLKPSTAQSGWLSNQTQLPCLSEPSVGENTSFRNFTRACDGGGWRGARGDRLRASSISPDKMMKVLVALLLATSVEGLNTKKQVALKKPLLLRGGALDAKTALLTQTAGLAAFGSEFILSKWASTRYWVRARRYTRKPHTLRA